MSQFTLSRGRARRRLVTFRRHQGGASAVEFALVAPFFFALMFAIFEFAFLFFAGQVLETATHDTARLVMTGQAQSEKLNKAEFKEKFCARIVALFDCKNGISIDVKAYPSFGLIKPEDVALPIDKNRNFIDNMRYEPGKEGEIVIVRVFYQWQLFLTSFGLDLANLSGGKHLLSATAAFRNEPFGTGS